MSRRLHVFLSDEVDRRLALLRDDGGFASDAETIRAAVATFEVLVRARLEAATVIVRDCTGVEREVIVPGGAADHGLHCRGVPR